VCLNACTAAAPIAWSTTHPEVGPLILGIDRFMSMFRALINMVGNGVATVVVARWENELDRKSLQQLLG
jgi:aerobic C4-dicarboxylate transport protein